jgi:parallel beta-helix repeat protein
MFILLSANILTLASNIQPVKASGTIYIRADGSIDPQTALISTVDNVTYTLTGDINDSIVVERDNVLLDGAGYILQGAGVDESRGIHLDGRDNVTIKNMEIKGFSYGIWINSSSNNVMSGNNITDNGYGAYVENSSNNSISGNNITGNVQAGVYLFWYSFNNTISGNNLVDNYFRGIWLYAYSSNNTVSRNNITGNYWGIDLWGVDNNTVSGNVFINDGLEAGYSYDNLVVDNSVNGKPLVYLENVSDRIVDDAGQVVLINCSDIIVENLNLSHATVGVNLWETKNTRIAKNNITANERAGIFLGVSSNNTVYGNNIANNGDGITLLDHCSDNTFYGNNISANDYGIWLLSDITNNTISGNNITANNYGIWLYYSSDNFIFHNSFVNNVNQVYTEGSVNTWDNGYPSGGNYWSNYNGIDSQSGPYQNETGSDGIGDTPYVIDGNNEDMYPLMQLYVPLIGDLNLDRIVNILDAIQAGSAFGSRPGDSNWNSQADLNSDNRINILDIVILANNFGKH